MESKTEPHNRLILHPSFISTIKTIYNELKIGVPEPISEQVNFDSYSFPSGGKLVAIEREKTYKLDAKIGEELSNKIVIWAYDESFNKYVSLEGTAFLTSHSLIVHGRKDYLPVIFMTFYFYTHSKEYGNKSQCIKCSKKTEVEFKKDYVKDRERLLSEAIPSKSNSLIFIDGPLIAAQISSSTVRLNRKLLEKNMIPIFCVKNSFSNMVVDNTKELRGKFNSDLHWAFKTLKCGERTNFFKYVDRHSPEKSKIFCYVKAFDISPQRIEFHPKTYEKYGSLMKDLMSLVYYLMLVQGDMINFEVRPIAIAEKYARDALKLVDLVKVMRSIYTTPTMNQDRFGG